MTTLHFMHIGKTGGTAVKIGLRRGGFAYRHERRAPEVRETPFGKIRLHGHSFRLDQLPPDDYVFFFLRDPISRFVSGFDSRLHEGRPHYHVEWTPRERQAFEAFPTPQRLASALVSQDADERLRARHAMSAIRHLRFQTRWTGPPKRLRPRLHQVVYIGRQETLDADWERLKAVLGLPEDLELPSDLVTAHRRMSDDAPLDAVATEALREWYARDYRLLNVCEAVRAERRWPARRRGRLALRSLRGWR